MSNEETIRAESLDEIVFAHRNKEYGAYELRKRYKRNVTVSLMIAFVVLLITTGTPFIMAQLNQDNSNYVDETVSADLMNVTKQEEELPPPPPPPPPPAEIEQQARFTAPVVVDTVAEEVEIATADEIVSTTTNDEVTEEVVETVEVIQEVEEEVINFYVIEEKPEFPGGEEALLKYIAENTKYPEIAKENNIQGKVFVEFVIQKDGSVGGVKVLRGVDPYLDAEAIRVVKSLPSWTPGKQRGKAVKVSFQVPINFKLY